MSLRIVKAANLPECELCGVPVKRARWERNGGLCTPCGAGIRRAAGMLPPLVEK